MNTVSGVTVSLYPHQIKASEMLADMECSRTITIDQEKLTKVGHFTLGSIIDTKVGIYGDITGYGKTLAFLAFLCKYYANRRQEPDYLKQRVISEDVTTVSQISGFIKLTSTSTVTTQQLPQTLIIINKQISSQWEKELNRTDLKYLFIYNRKSIPETIEDVTSYEVILCTNTMSKEFCHSFGKCTWTRVVIDEPTENPVPEFYIASFYWLITASYRYIPVSTRGRSLLTALFNSYSYPMYCELLTIKNDDQYVRNSYNMTPILTINHNYYENSLGRVVSAFISSDIVTMIKGGNMKGAISALGGKSTDVSIVDLVTKDKTQKLKEAKLKLDYYTTKYLVEKNNEFKKPYEHWRDVHFNLERDLDSIKKSMTESINRGCVICCGQFEDNKVILVPCCQNIVCAVCLFAWMEKQHTCIYCRSELAMSNVIYLDPCTMKAPRDKEEQQVQEEIDTSAVQGKFKISLKKKKQSRLEIIVGLIKSNPFRKYIIASYSDNTFCPIKGELKNQGIDFIEIKGNKAHIDKDLRRLADGDIKVVFLNAMYMGTGLNLQMMTDIIIYHQMADSAIMQLVGRINRIGSNEVRGNITPRLHKFIEMA